MLVDIDELCEWEIETSNLSPILDPLTIMANISSNDDSEE